MPHHSRPSSPNSALAWALLSQTVWLPLLALDLHDRWQAQIAEQREIAEAAARRSHRGAIPENQRPGAAATANRKLADTGLLLGSASHSPLNPTDRADVVRQPGLVGFATTGPSRSPYAGATANPLGSSAGAGRSGQSDQPKDGHPFSLSTTPGLQNPLLNTFNRAELLGGSIGLSDLNSAAMPPMAMAERARWQGSGDPLAPLPGTWREPMRRALHGLAASKGAPTSVTAARVVHVPSLRVRQSTPVPLALQPDGSVDILTKPDNPAVVDEIRQWSSRQPTSKQAGVTAAVVHLEPLPEAPRHPQPPLLRTTTVAPIPAPLATSSRPAAAEPAATPSPPPVAAAPAPEVTPPPAPAPSAPAPATADAVPLGAGASTP